MAYDNKLVLVAQSGIPVGIPSSGSIGTNGALTLTTALTVIYNNIWLFFPAGAVFTGSPAGLYFCQMTSTTLGTVFNNLLGANTPYIPSQANPLVGAGPGAYTQATTIQNLSQFLLPGGSMGNNGSLQVDVTWSYNNSAGAKTLGMLFGVGNAIFSLAPTTTATQSATKILYSAGGQATQVLVSAAQLTQAAAAGVLQQFGLDTSVNQTIPFTGTLAAATDFLVLNGFRVIAAFG